MELEVVEKVKLEKDFDISLKFLLGNPDAVQCLTCRRLLAQTLERLKKCRICRGKLYEEVNDAK